MININDYYLFRILTRLFILRKSIFFSFIHHNFNLQMILWKERVKWNERLMVESQQDIKFVMDVPLSLPHCVKKIKIKIKIEIKCVPMIRKKNSQEPSFRSSFITEMRLKALFWALKIPLLKSPLPLSSYNFHKNIVIFLLFGFLGTLCLSVKPYHRLWTRIPLMRLEFNIMNYFKLFRLAVLAIFVLKKILLKNSLFCQFWPFSASRTVKVSGLLIFLMQIFFIFIFFAVYLSFLFIIFL